MPSRFIGEIDARAARGWQGRWPAEATKATTRTTNKDMRELAPLFADSAWLRLVSHTERKTERECLVLCLVLVMPFPTTPCRAEFAVASSRRVASQNNRAVIKKSRKNKKKTTTEVPLNLWIYQLHTRLAPGQSCTIKGANLARTTGHTADAKLTRIWSALATATATAPAPARAASRQTCARLLQGRQRGVIV